MEVENMNCYEEVANCRHMFELETRLFMETVSKLQFNSSVLFQHSATHVDERNV